MTRVRAADKDENIQDRVHADRTCSENPRISGASLRTSLSRRCKNWSYSNALCGNYRYLESTLRPTLLPTLPRRSSRCPSVWFPISPPLSRPGFLALQPERLATSSSGDEDDVRRRRDQHVPTALPSGNYRKPRLSEEATLAHPFFPLSFSFLRCILSSFGFPLLHPFFVRFSRLLST